MPDSKRPPIILPSRHRQRSDAIFMRLRRASGPRPDTRELEFSREIARNQPLQFCRRLLFVGSVDHDLDLVMLLHAQRQHAEDALGVRPWTVAGGVTHPDL